MECILCISYIPIIRLFFFHILFPHLLGGRRGKGGYKNKENSTELVQAYRVISTWLYHDIIQ